jgi:hypothetical protein
MMKTILATTLALLMTTTASAKSGVEIAAGYEDGASPSTGDSAALIVRPFTDVGDYQVAVRTVAQRSVDTGTMYNFFEPQVSRTFNVGNGVNLTATGGIGLLTGKTDSRFYYTGEAKATFAMTDSFSVGTAVRYRNSVEQQLPFESMTYSVGLAYRVLTDTNVALVGYSKNLEENSHGYYVSVTQTF